MVIPALIIAIASSLRLEQNRKEDESKVLQYMLSILIVGTAVKMWMDMISK